MKPSEIYDLEQQEKAKARIWAILVVICILMWWWIFIPWKALSLFIVWMPWYGYILLIPIWYIILMIAVTIIWALCKALFQK